MPAFSQPRTQLVRRQFECVRPKSFKPAGIAGCEPLERRRGDGREVTLEGLGAAKDV